MRHDLERQRVDENETRSSPAVPTPVTPTALSKIAITLGFACVTWGLAAFPFTYLYDSRFTLLLSHQLLEKGQFEIEEYFQTPPDYPYIFIDGRPSSVEEQATPPNKPLQRAINSSVGLTGTTVWRHTCVAGASAVASR